MPYIFGRMTEPGMALETKRLPKITDEERHQRFVETARDVEASDKPEDFDQAFEKIVKPKEKLKNRWCR